MEIAPLFGQQPRDACTEGKIQTKSEWKILPSRPGLRHSVRVPTVLALTDHAATGRGQAVCAPVEYGAIDLYDATGAFLERMILVGDAHCLAIDLGRLIPHLLAADCRAIMLHHSHPSGDPEPSAADLVATRKLAGLLRGLGLQLHDHRIHAGTAHVSLRARGLL